jgi:hypothetical protein
MKFDGLLYLRRITGLIDGWEVVKVKPIPVAASGE